MPWFAMICPSAVAQNLLHLWAVAKQVLQPRPRASKLWRWKEIAGEEPKGWF
jgi:hypothetical protein